MQGEEGIGRRGEGGDGMGGDGRGWEGREGARGVTKSEWDLTV